MSVTDFDIVQISEAMLLSGSTTKEANLEMIRLMEEKYLNLLSGTVATRYDPSRILPGMSLEE